MARRWSMHTNLLLVVVGLATALVSLPATAADESASPTPTPVTVGLYVIDVTDLNLRRGTYTLDFYVWFRWQGDIAPQQFEFPNGEILAKENPDFVDTGEVKYVSYRCRVLFRSTMDLKDFPLDAHSLSIEMEDATNDARSLVYVPDLDNTTVSAVASSPGWVFGEPSLSAFDFVYDTNYGNPTRAPGEKAVYSRFSMEIPITRPDLSIYYKTFVSLFISVAIAFLAFLIRPEDLDPRFGVGIAAVFGTVSSHIVVAQGLPATAYYSLADKLHLVGLFFVFLTLFVSCVSLRLTRVGRTGPSRTVDRWLGVIFPLTFALLVVIFSVWD